MQGYFWDAGGFAHNNSILCASWGVSSVWQLQNRKKKKMKFGGVDESKKEEG